MKMIKRGDSGPEVHTLQQNLLINRDGIFGRETEKHVIRFQLMHNISADGIVGADTWALLLQLPNAMTIAIDEDTDIHGQMFKTSYDQIIHKHYLPKGEYVEGPVINQYIFLHHTAGNANPYRCIDHWGRDSRGRIATEFVLGGVNHRNGNDDYNGVMVQAFPTGAQGFHLGKTGSGYMNRHSVGIEICNMGYLDSKNMQTYVGSVCQEDQVCELPEHFKKKLHWHNYTEEQIKATEKWIKWVGERDGVDIRLGLKQYIKKYGPTKGFDFQEDAWAGKVKGLLTHGNVRTGKSDIYPHPDMVDMIMSL
tara:strand:+ start:3439 stop:4362 length:924 start_codon:yes stop_codon:yes gene_type:complete